jgi:uncharacterized membrane protein
MKGENQSKHKSKKDNSVLIHENSESLIKYRIHQPSFSEIQRSVKHSSRSVIISVIFGISVAFVIILIVNLLLYS